MNSNLILLSSFIEHIIRQERHLWLVYASEGWLVVLAWFVEAYFAFSTSNELERVALRELGIQNKYL